MGTGSCFCSVALGYTEAGDGETVLYLTMDVQESLPQTGSPWASVSLSVTCDCNDLRDLPQRDRLCLPTRAPGTLCLPLSPLPGSGGHTFEAREHTGAVSPRPGCLHLLGHEPALCPGRGL